MIAEDFIEKFHNLEGTFLKQRKKSLFLLLENYRTFLSEDCTLQEINEKLKPETYLEESYKLELLLYYKRSSELLDLLQKGNDEAASKIIRQSWFIKSIFNHQNSEYFVQYVFSQLSVVVRSKIIKQILKEFKNEKIINALFDSLLENYGFKPAIILLSGCSVDKIKEILLYRGLKLSKAQLKLLHDKDPSLISFYYDEFHRRGENMYELSCFSKYLSRKDANLYVKLLIKYKFYSYKFGRRTTKKYVLENMADILRDPQKYLDLGIFQKNALVKHLGESFPIFLKAAFPKELPKLMHSHAFCLLQYYNKKKRYELYKKIFEDVYKSSLYCHKDCITHGLLEIIQIDEEREKWVEIFENHVEYVKYKRSSLAVPELKEQLVRCDSIQFRQQLFRYIVASCSISKDHDALLDILKIFCNRFRNTDGLVVCQFLDDIVGNIELKKLTSEHWKYIHEILLIQNIRNLSVNVVMVIEYSKFLYRNGKWIEEMIPLYLNSFENIQFRSEKFKVEEFDRIFLELILNYCTDNNIRLRVEVILHMIEWDKRHPDKTFISSKNTKIIRDIKEALEENLFDFSKSTLKYLFCNDNISEILKDIYFNSLQYVENMTITKWYLKHEPAIFETNIHVIIPYFKKKSRYRLLKFLRKYEHTGLVQKINKYCMETFIDPTEKEKDGNATILASIMPKNDFLKLLEEYVPKIDKLDLKEASVEETNLHLIQIALVKSIPFTTCQVDAFPILLKYCRGDYFQSSLSSLYCCFNRVPEESLKSVLDILLGKPVSVRKHSIFLAALVFPIKTNEELGQKILTCDKNDSVQKHLFTSTFKYFLKNPLDKFWNILRTYMSHISLSEEESLQLLTDIHVIPDSYKSVFMAEVLKIFDELEKKEKTTMNVYYDLMMQSIKDDDIRLLSRELCLGVIHKSLSRSESKMNNECVYFTVKFLMYATNMRENIQNILKALEIYKQKHLNNSYGEVIKTDLYNICKSIYNKAMNEEALKVVLPKDFPLILSEEWKNIFSINDTLDEYLMLDFMILKYQDNRDINFFAVEINRIFKNLRENFGDLITGFFKDFLLKSLKLILGNSNFDLKLMKLLAWMIQKDSSLPNFVLVSQLLPSYQSDDEFVENYNSVLEKLWAGDEIVRQYLNKYFKTGRN